MGSRLQGAPVAPSGPETDEGVSGSTLGAAQGKKSQGKARELFLGPVTFPCEAGARPTGGAQAWLVA